MREQEINKDNKSERKSVTGRVREEVCKRKSAKAREEMVEGERED